MDEASRRRVGTLLQERLGRLALEELLPEERDYVLLWELHTEVSNGTFDQYLCNSSGDHAEDALAALSRLESVRLADTLRRALVSLPGGWSAVREERERRVSAVPDRWDLFRELAEEFHESVESEAAVGERVADRILAAYRREGLLD